MTEMNKYEKKNYQKSLKVIKIWVGNWQKCVKNEKKLSKIMQKYCKIGENWSIIIKNH